MRWMRKFGKKIVGEYLVYLIVRLDFLYIEKRERIVYKYNMFW